MENLLILAANVCNNSGVKHAMVIFGWVLMCITILVPVILIIIGVKDIADSVINQEDSSSAIKLTIVKFFVGAMIFFLPRVIYYVFTDVVSIKSDASTCIDCFFDPNDCYKKVLVQKEQERKEKEEAAKKEEEEKKKDPKPSDPVNPEAPSPSDPNPGTPTPEEPSGDYHINSINGIKYNLYNQNDPRWANVGTIGEDGCHIVSAAVIASAGNSSITPAVVHSRHTHSYPYTVVNDMAGDTFSCRHISSSTSKQDIISHLQKGNSMVIMVYGPKKGGASNFTSSQHYISLIDYQNGKIFVGNSYGSGTGSYNRNGWFDADVVLTSIREINLCEPKNINTSPPVPDEEIKLNYSFHTDSTIRYALYSPSSANSNSNVPLIVWLHGSGEINTSESAFKNSGLLATLNSWTLDGFNAYVLCPISPSYSWSNSKNAVYDLINKIVKEKNINPNRIILVGHSMGAMGVFQVADGKSNFFSSYAILSGYGSNVDLNQFKNKNVKIYVGNPSYGEDTTSYNYTNSTLKSYFGNVEVLNTSHGGLPKTVFNLDRNNNHKSDLIEWMLGN